GAAAGGGAPVRAPGPRGGGGPGCGGPPPPMPRAAGPGGPAPAPAPRPAPGPGDPRRQQRPRRGHRRQPQPFGPLPVGRLCKRPDPPSHTRDPPTGPSRPQLSKRQAYPLLVRYGPDPPPDSVIGLDAFVRLG